jgi:hypothetical protein
MEGKLCSAKNHVKVDLTALCLGVTFGAVRRTFGLSFGVQASACSVEIRVSLADERNLELQP